MLQDQLRDLSSTLAHLGVEHGPPPAEEGLGTWVRSDRFRDPRWWPDLAARYAEGIGTGRAVVGGSCALQGHAGRVAALVIGYWISSANLLDLTEGRLWVRVEAGRTTAVTAWPAVVAQEQVTAGRVAEELVDLLSPVVAACRTIHPITARVAWGNIAAACAGVFRAIGAAAGPASWQVKQAALDFLDDPAWPVTGLVTVFSDEHHHLTYDRRTCCLMRLAPAKDECGSCSRLDPDQRRERWRTAGAPVVHARIEVAARADA